MPEGQTERGSGCDALRKYAGDIFSAKAGSMLLLLFDLKYYFKVFNMENKKALPRRKSPRLNGFDYSKSGAYFLTICTQDRKNILSTVVGEGSPLPYIRLSPYGKILNEWIKKIPEKYPEASVDCYIIMPNHIHILLSLKGVDGAVSLIQ